PAGPRGARPGERGKPRTAHMADGVGEGGPRAPGGRRRAAAREGPRRPQEPPGPPAVTPPTAAAPGAPHGPAGGLTRRLQEGAAWDTLRAHADDPRLQEEVQEAIAAALGPLAPATDAEALALAGQVLDHLAAAEEERHA